MNVESAAETPSIAAAKRSANWTVSRALRERKERMVLIVHRRHRRRRSQADREARASLAGADALLKAPAGRAQIRVPDGQSPWCIGRIGERGDTLGVGARSPGAIGDDDKGAHLVVNIAAERDDSRLVEMDRARLVLGEQLELEPFRRRAGVNVMLGRIEIRKGYIRADRDNGQEWVKLDVLLRNDEAAAGARRTGRIASRVERHNRVANGMSRGVDHPHRERGRTQWSGQAHARHNDKSTHHGGRLRHNR